MDNITSRDNQYVRQTRRLLGETKYRRQTGLFALEGARLCGDAAASGIPIQTVLVTRRAAETYAATLQSLLATSSPPIWGIPPRRRDCFASPRGLTSLPVWIQ